MKSRKVIYILCEAAMLIAVALVLDLLKKVLPGQLPNGGCLFNISMLPIVLFGIRHGVGWGTMTGFVYGGLNYLLGLDSMAIDWTTIICDYFLAFAMLGLGAGLFKGRRGAAYWGTLVGGSLQFLSSYLVGVFVWGKWMPDEFLGLTMTSPWFYSFLYNILWAAPNIVLTLVVFALLYRSKPMQRFLTGSDLQRF